MTVRLGVNAIIKNKPLVVETAESCFICSGNLYLVISGMYSGHWRPAANTRLKTLEVFVVMKRFLKYL